MITCENVWKAVGYGVCGYVGTAENATFLRHTFSMSRIELLKQVLLLVSVFLDLVRVREQRDSIIPVMNASSSTVFNVISIVFFGEAIWILTVPHSSSFLPSWMANRNFSFFAACCTVVALVYTCTIQLRFLHTSLCIARSAFCIFMYSLVARRVLFGGRRRATAERPRIVVVQ